MKKIIFSSLIFFLLFIASVSAQSISATNSTGHVKDYFYTNETVYVTSFGNILSNSSDVWIYIVSNSDSWTNNTNLTDVSTGRKLLTTNSTGSLLTAVVWGPPLKTGQYDVIVDIDRDGKYNTSDFIDNATTVGFEVVDVPTPSLAVSLGSYSPADHKFNISSGTLDNIVMQLKLVVGGIGGSTERVKLNSIGLTANGTGNEKNGISSVKLIVDSNGNGTIDSGEVLIAYNKFLSDNGVLILSVTGDDRLIMNTSSTHYLLTDYVMSTNNYDGDTFQIQLVSISAVGENSGRAANITGLPIYSTITTITDGKTKTVTIVCSDYKNQSSCPSSCQWCSSDSTCRNLTETCPTVCSGTISLNVEQLQNNSLATITGLSGCDNKILYLKENSCIGNTIGNCTIKGTGCSINFATPSEGNHTYYACLDKNNNGNFDTEDQSSAILSVTIPSLPVQIISKISGYLIWIVLAIVIPLIIVMFWLWRRKPKEFRYEYKP